MSLLEVEVPYSAYIGQNRAGFVFTSAYWPDDFDKNHLLRKHGRLFGKQVVIIIHTL